MKYIIDTDDFKFTLKTIVVMGIAGCVSKSVDDLDQLTADYINEHFSDLQDTAYQKGFEDGKKAFDLLESERNSEYQRGLSEGNDIGYKDGVKDGQNEAWEAAKKIFGYEMDGGIPLNEIGKVFGYAEDATFCTADIIRHNTASEAIAKMKAYEEKQKAEDEIEVGDEVNWLGDCFIVTRIFQPRNMKEQCDGIDDDGCVYHDVLIKDLEKTGRHFDIASILEAMKHD